MELLKWTEGAIVAHTVLSNLSGCTNHTCYRDGCVFYSVLSLLDMHSCSMRRCKVKRRCHRDFATMLSINSKDQFAFAAASQQWHLPFHRAPFDCVALLVRRNSEIDSGKITRKKKSRTNDSIKMKYPRIPLRTRIFCSIFLLNFSSLVPRHEHRAIESPVDAHRKSTHCRIVNR